MNLYFIKTFCIMMCTYICTHHYTMYIYLPVKLTFLIVFFYEQNTVLKQIIYLTVTMSKTSFWFNHSRKKHNNSIKTRFSICRYLTEFKNSNDIHLLHINL